MKQLIARTIVHTLKRENRQSFHRFPADPERRKKWAAALKKLNRDGTTWTPSATARLCGQHFINGMSKSTTMTHKVIINNDNNNNRVAVWQEFLLYPPLKLP